MYSVFALHVNITMTKFTYIEKTFVSLGGFEENWPSGEVEEM
jgi:hypothetical protein